MESYLGFGTGGIGRVKWRFIGGLTAMVEERALVSWARCALSHSQGALSTESLSKAVSHKG